MAENNYEQKPADLSSDFKGPPIAVQPERDWRSPNAVDTSKTAKMIQWAIQHSGGYIKNEQQARYLILGLSLVVVVVALFIAFSGNGGLDMPLPPGATVIYPPNEPPRLQ